MSSNPPFKAELLELIATLTRPIDFASKNNFAFLSTIKDFESFAVETVDNVKALKSLPKDISDKIDGLARAFEGFDALSDDLKKERISSAADILDTIRQSVSEGGGDATAPSEKPLPEPPPKKPKTAVPMTSYKDTTERLKKLSTSIQYLKGVGPKLAEIFAGKGIETVEDFLYFLPIRYEDRRDVRKISLLEVGMSGTTTGGVVVAGPVQYGRRRGYEVVISDGKGLLKLKWFNFKKQYMEGRYKQGKWVRAYGMVTAYGQQKEIIHPDVEFIDKDEAEEGEVDLKPSEAIVPVYSKLANLHQKTIRKIMLKAVEDYAEIVVSGATADGVSGRGLLTINEAFRIAHSVSAMKDGGDAEDVVPEARERPPHPQVEPPSFAAPVPHPLQWNVSREPLTDDPVPQDSPAAKGQRGEEHGGRDEEPAERPLARQP